MDQKVNRLPAGPAHHSVMMPTAIRGLKLANDAQFTATNELKPMPESPNPKAILQTAFFLLEGGGGLQMSG